MMLHINRHAKGFVFVGWFALALTTADAQHQLEPQVDDPVALSDVALPATGPPVTIYNLQSQQGSAANFTAALGAQADVTISLVNAADGDGNVSIAAPGDFTLEVRISSWDPNGVGTLLKSWEVTIDSSGYTSGLQGFLTPTVVECTSDEDCKAAFGALCYPFSRSPCLTVRDCPLGDWACIGSECDFPVSGPSAGTQCQPGFLNTAHLEYVYLYSPGDLDAVDISTINYRYASTVATGDGAPPHDPFPAGGAYAGTLQLSASADCGGTFTIGFFPPPLSVLINQDNEFIPFVEFVPAQVTCEIGRCCFDLTGAVGCWDNVSEAQCDQAPGANCWTSDPTATCNDPCVECIDGIACQDDLWCNGVEVCDQCTQCQPGTPPDCDDGIPCTVDSCVEDGANTGHCENIPDDASCDDGLFCTGIEFCDPVTGCSFGSSPCDDGVFCTDDSCDEGTTSCENLPNISHCINNLFCDGFETCHPTLDCQPGPAPCDDGVDCTIDNCDEATRLCAHDSDDGLCDDGEWCNGLETCDAATGCQIGTDACETGICDEANDQCLPPEIPTVSAWGLLALALLLLSGLKIRNLHLFYPTEANQAG